MQNRPTIGITMGDPSGVGPEVISKAILDPKIRKLGRIIIIGSEFVFSKVPSFKKAARHCQIIDLKNVPKKNFSFGKTSLIYGQASFEYLVFSLALLRAKKIDCLVTGPVSKELIALAGHRFTGHTEFLRNKIKVRRVAMMFVAGNLKVVLATRHLSLRRAIKRLTKRRILDTISLTYTGLRNNFGIKNPRIGVLGLNPHAGEGGILGLEEKRVITPVIKKARKRLKTKAIYGPLVADTAFSESARKKFDCIIAMYHDQGLIPVKTLYFSEAVNVTLGLPFVRTSPSHGTAFDIAGKNKADSTSMKEAIKLAVRLHSR